MEKDSVKPALEMAARNPLTFNEILPHLNPNLLFLSKSFNVNDQNNNVMGEFPVLAAAMAGESSFQNQVGSVNLTTLISDSTFESRIMRNVPQIGTSGTLVGEAGIQDESAGRTVISASSLDAFLAATSNVQENLEKSTALTPPVCQLQPQTIDMTSNVSSNPLYGSSDVCVYQEHPSNMDNFLNSSELGRITASRGLQKLPSSGDPIPNGWFLTNTVDLNMEGHDGRSNELSLSLATSQSLLAARVNGIDQCSEVNCSDAALRHLNVTRSGLETCSNRRFSLGSSANNALEFSQAILGSRYLSAIQEFLAQIARYSLENVDQAYGSAAGIPGSISKLSSNKGVLMDADTGLDIQMNSRLQSHAIESDKTRLLTLLQLVDEQYNQCVDEIHTVVSAFHAATELDPRVHTHFALQTISHSFKGLRERISSCILAAGSNFDTSSTKQKDNSFESSILKQWTLRQLKRKDHHIWRPQRGLPEKSVSVLRAWMFQNFLHPYPKDTEKHLLAVKSGLSRNQVSNWFINARVRLWKPMIEEMCAEMNRRNACRNHTSISNQR